MLQSNTFAPFVDRKAKKYLPEGLNKAENCKNSFLTHSRNTRPSGGRGPHASKTHRDKDTHVVFGLKTDFNRHPAVSTHLLEFTRVCPQACGHMETTQRRSAADTGVRQKMQRSSAVGRGGEATRGCGVSSLDAPQQWHLQLLTRWSSSPFSPRRAGLGSTL